MPERPENVLKILDMTQRNLTILETQAAAMGVLAPPYIQIGIKEARDSIKDLEKRYIEAGGTLPIPNQNNQVPNTQPTNPPVQTEPAKTVSIQTPTTGEKPARTKVFISYSHKDKVWLDRIQEHLTPYEHTGWTDKEGKKRDLEIWKDTTISEGTKWFDEIKKGLNATKVGVCLITPAYLSSKFITTQELPDFLTASEQEGLIIFPVIITSSAFSNTWLGDYQSFNPPSEPLDKLTKPKREEELARLATRIIEALKR